MRYLTVLLLQLPDLLPLDWIARLHAWWLSGKDILYRQYLVKQLELLFGNLFVLV